MKTLPHKTERIHSLDSLRAIMMLLGLVLHSAITYAVTDYGAGWLLKDTGAVHISNDYIQSLIHVFRMPSFFVVAGFFAAMLFYERSPKRMIRNRINRILLPFIVFLLILWPFIAFTWTYTTMVLAGTENSLAETLKIVGTPLVLIPLNTFHLWFLYYLALITAASVGIALILKKLPSTANFISQAFSWVIQKPIVRLLIFAALTTIIYFIIGTWSVAISTSFMPDLNTFIYYSFFYFAGWILFKSKHLLDTLMKLDWISTVLGLTLFTVHFFMYDSFNYETHIILKSIMVWLFVFGITGLFIRYGSNHSARMRYVSDSSYWVYLVHLPLTAIIPSFIVDWPLPATIKFLLVLISTGIICFVSYHYLVRGSFIGKFLNGRKYTRRLSDIKQEEESARLKPVLDK
jgi:glucan biosynthesis protein C|tara:strand:- start:58 stop:1269 length:1212 start_codon:yes stop_codon:yes gene_type:complete